MADGWDIRDGLLDPLAGCYAEAQRLMHAYAAASPDEGGRGGELAAGAGGAFAHLMMTLWRLPDPDNAPLFWEDGAWEPAFDADERPTPASANRLRLPLQRGLIWLNVRGLHAAARELSRRLRHAPRRVMKESDQFHAGPFYAQSKIDSMGDVLRGTELHLLLLADELTPVFYPGDGAAGGGASADPHADCRYETPVPSGDRAELRRRLLEQAERDPRFTVPTEAGGGFSQRNWARLVGAAPRTVGTDEFYLMTLDKVRGTARRRPVRAAVDSAAVAVTRPEDDPLARLVAGEEEDAERSRQIAALTAEQRRDGAADRAGRPGKV